MVESPIALFSMLSRLLIAYTYEFDAAMNRELKDSAEPAPSLAMWANVLQYVSEDGISTKELRSRSGVAAPALKSMTDCLKRHGWITAGRDGWIELTPAAVVASRTFPKAKAAAEQSCKERWGSDTYQALEQALHEASTHIAQEYPQYPMPSAHRGALPCGE